MKIYDADALYRAMDFGEIEAKHWVAYDDVQRVMLAAIAHLEHDADNKAADNALAVLKESLELNHG